MSRGSGLMSALALASALFVLPAAAQDSGFYFEASVGQAQYDVGASDGINIGILNAGFVVHLNTDSIETEDDSTAWDLAIGYRVNRYLAAEISYLDFGDADVSERYDTTFLRDFFPSFPAQLTSEYTTNVSGPAVSILGSLPLGAGFELHARIGYLFADQHIEQTYPSGRPDETFGSEEWMGGIGVSWSFARHWALRLEYLETSTLDDTSFLGETKLKSLRLGTIFRL